MMQQPHTLDSLKKQYSQNILFYIARSKNANVVVYEANLLPDGQLNSSDPVHVYWLDIDPEFVKKNRAKGVNSDRSELNFLEKTMAYGLSSEPLGNGSYRLKLVALSERLVHVAVENGKPVARVQVQGQFAKLHRVYVKSVERMLGLPKVEYVEIEGVNDDGSRMYERIVPK